VDSVISQLKKDFYTRLSSLQGYTVPQSDSTLSLLTDEELQELQNRWVELKVWKKSQSH
jgi:hypothetical protein